MTSNLSLDSKVRIPHLNPIQQVGCTPLVDLTELFDCKSTLLAKLENLNPSGTIKDRLARWIVESDAPKSTATSGVYVDVSVGNFGLSLSWFSRILGKSAVILLPRDVDVPLAQRIKLYGGEVVFTNTEDVKELDQLAREFALENGHLYVGQFVDTANIEMNATVLASEIEAQVSAVDFVVLNIGSGGTLMGLSKGLPSCWQTKFVRVSAAEEKARPWLPLVEESVLWETIEVSFEQAYEVQKEMIRRGLRVGAFSAVSLCGALELTALAPPRSTVLTLISDSA